MKALNSVEQKMFHSIAGLQKLQLHVSVATTFAAA